MASSYKFLPFSRTLKCLNVSASHLSTYKCSWKCFSSGIPIHQEIKANLNLDSKEINGNLENNSYGRDISTSKRNSNSSEKFLRFDKNPDKFGTLSSDRLARNIIERGDGEEDDSVEEVNYIDGIKGKKRLQPVNYAMMIKHNLNQNRLADALAVLEVTMLQEHKAKPDKYIYNLLISGCARHGYTKKAFQLYNQMKKRSIIPRLSTYTSLFNACANGPWDHDSLARAKHLRELMIEKGVQPNVTNYNAMIKAFGRHGDLETSFSIMDEMLSKNMAVDSVTFCFLLQAALQDKEAGFRHALLVWRKMMDMKILPTTYSFNLLLRTVRDCGTGDLESSKEIISLLSPTDQKYIAGNESSESEAVEVLDSPNMLLPTPQQGSLVGISNNLQKPWHRLVLLGSLPGVLRTMDNAKATPDIKSFTLLLDIIPNSDEAELNLIKEMKQRGVKPDVGFFNILIKKRNSSSRFASAKDVLELIRNEKLVPNIMTFGVLAMGCNTYQSAKELIRNINDVGFRVNEHILTTLLTRAKVNLDIDTVIFIIETLRSEKIIPDIKFFSHLKFFRDAAIVNLELKESGKPHIVSIDTPNFNEKFKRLLHIIEEIEKDVVDPSSVHPWSQYKIPAKSKVKA